MQTKLHAIADYIRSAHIPVYTISMAEGDGDPLTECITPANPCQDSYSVAKAFTTTAIGMLWDEEKLHTEDKIHALLPEAFAAWKDEIDPRWYDTTVDMALTHHLGLPGGFLDIDGFDATTFGRDYLHHMLTAPLVCAPKAEGIYTDAAFYLLGRIVTALSGENLTSFLWKRLFYPTGCKEISWSTCPMGYAMGATGLYIRSEDMGKLGQVYVSGGTYRGTRIVSPEWIALCRERGYELHHSGGGWYGKGGMRGQMLTMHFAKRLTIAWHGYEADCGKILEYIANEV